MSDDANTNELKKPKVSPEAVHVNGDDSCSDGGEGEESTHYKNVVMKAHYDDDLQNGNAADEEIDHVRSDREDDGDDSGGTSSSDESDDDSQNENGDNKGVDEGISEYEKLRLARIKRNQEYLAKLGLEGNKKDGKSGMLGPSPKKRAPRPSNKRQIPTERRSTLSRQSKKRVDYTEMPASFLVEESDRKQRATGDGSDERRKERQRSHRMEKFIYLEFKRIASQRKQNVTKVKRQLRHAERYVKHWHHRARIWTKQREKDMAIERVRQKHIRERQALGGQTLMELLKDIDEKIPVMSQLVWQYDQEQRSHLLEIEQAKKHEGHLRKMQAIDDLDRFPKALKEAITSLNALLYERSPRDPPPPRRSKRNAEDVETNIQTKSKKKSKTADKSEVESDPSSPGSTSEMIAADSTASWSMSLDAVSTEPLTTANIEQIPGSEDASDLPSKHNASKSQRPSTKKSKRDVARNVGGWVSPAFASEVDRTWLEKNHAQHNFDLSNLPPPQVGQVMLYYPAAHLEFLRQNPDHLNSKIRDSSRIPLWNRATKDGQRKKAAAVSKDPVPQTTKAAWWNEEWLQGFHNSNFGNFPLVVRVERTHAEFPKDPYADQKNVVKSNDKGHTAVRLEWGIQACGTPGAKNTGNIRKGGTSKGKGKVKMRLSVLLRPLTPLLPPVFENSGAKIMDDLALPPIFSVVTFPSRSEPFLIPFAWGYCAYHSLTVGDTVESRILSQSSKSKPHEGLWKGRVVSFESIGEQAKTQEQGWNDPGKNLVQKNFGSFRLDDKMAPLKAILDQLQNAILSGVTKRQAVESLLSQDSDTCTKPQAKSGTSTKLFPFPEICRVIDFWTQFRDRDQQSVASLSSRTATAPTSLFDLIRVTLPIRGAIGINSDTNQRKKEMVSRWSIHPVLFLPASGVHNQPNRRLQSMSGEGSVSQLGPWNVPGLSDGFPDKLEGALLTKLRCTIEDFIQGNGSVSIFVPPVSDAIAPGYSCAVPIGMCFQKILARLKLTKTASSPPRSYYSSVGSLLGDIQQIVDNCVLYNDPESIVAKIALDLIPSVKRLVTDVTNRHARETSSRIKAADERRRFVLQSCTSMALEGQPVSSEEVKGGGKSNLKKASAATGRGATALVADKFFAPFKRPLYRGWFQGLNPDNSWKQDSRPFVISKDVGSSSETNGEVKATSSVGSAGTTWIPQCSDKILYSRSLHSEWVKGHYHTLTDDQCQLPHFRFVNDESNDASEQESINHIPETTPGNLLEAVQTHWLVGTVAWVRTSFPRQAGTSTFMTEAPVLLIGIQFDYEWNRGQVHTVGWRPCLFPHLAAESQVKHDVLSSCERCGVSLSSSFLKPGWLSASPGMDKILPQTNSMPYNAIIQPSGMAGDIAGSICRCFDVLKRRCLQKDIPVDHIDSQRYLDGSLPVISRVQGLPVFGELFELASKNCDSMIFGSQEKQKSINTRGIKKPKGVDRSVTEKLAKWHYLPPWLKSQSAVEGIRKSKPMHHETLLPFPNASIESIRVRIQNGYYRSESAIRSDLLEAYVSSVLYVLSEPATRQNNPLSIRKLAKYLSSPKGNSGTNSLISNIRSSLTKKNLSKKATSKRVATVETSKKHKKAGEQKVSTNGLLAPLSKSKKLVIRIPSSKKKVAQISADDANKLAKITKNAVLDKKPNNQGLTKRRATKKASTGKKPMKKATVEKTSKKRPVEKKYPSNAAEENDTINGFAERKKGSSDADSPFSKEKGLVERIDGIRRLYAMALVCVSDAPCMERLFGLKASQRAPSHAREPNVNPTPAELDREAAIARVRVVLAALGRDQRRNRLPLYTPLKLKITCGGDVVRCAQPPVVLEDGRTITLSASHVTFSWDDCESNERLAQALFRRPSRGFPCARCQAYGTSFFTCRVKQGHSNPDFDFFQNFGGDYVGGVRALLAPLMPDPLNTAASAATEVQTGKSQHSSGKATASANTTTTTESNDEQKKAYNKPSAATEAKKDKIESEKKVTAARPHGAAEAQYAAKGVENPPRDNVIQPNTRDSPIKEKDNHDEADPLELLKKAQVALTYATKLNRDAETQSNLPVRLSDEFIKTTFPFDPTDDHYMYCIICGLSGDLLCCDGCSNVVHPSCIGLGEIPEDDWFCEQCVARKGSGTVNQSKTQNDEATNANEDGTSRSMIGDDRQNDPKCCNKSEAIGSKTESTERVSNCNNSITADPDIHAESGSTAAVPDTEKRLVEEKLQDEDVLGQSDDPDEVIYLQSVELDKLLEGLEPKAKTHVRSVQNDHRLGNEGNEQRAPDTQIATKANDQDNKQVVSNTPTNNHKRDGGDVEVSKILKKEFPIGTELIKNFGEFGDFKGQVVEMPTGSTPFYLVKYDDGDEEELSENELATYVVRRKPEPPEQQQTVNNEEKKNPPPPKKKRGRGRPRKSEKEEDPLPPLASPPKKQKKEIEPESEERRGTTRRPTFDVLAEVSKLAEDGN